MRPNLPKRFEPENTHFHPPVRYAVEAALVNLGLTNKYVVKAQYPSPTGPIDLVIFNVFTNKVALPIEVKRSQMDVRGGGRRQSRDYWQNLSSNRESPFYCVTNIEITEIFRFDEMRARTDAQQLSLASDYTTDLHVNSEEQIYIAMTKIFEEALLLLEGKTDFEYKNGLLQIAENVQRLKGSPKALQDFLEPVIFEYIRGHARKETVLGAKTKTWKNAQYYGSLNRLRDLLSDAGFSRNLLKGTSLPDFINADPLILSEAANAGGLGGEGQDLAELVHQAIYTQGIGGVVETDAELVALLYNAGLAVLREPLAQDLKILDPSAGSGSILAQMSNLAQFSIQPSSLVAIEKNEILMQLLELRIALSLDNQFSISNRPTLYNSELADIDRKALSDVNLVVMNPPYLSGISSKGDKEVLAGRISMLTGENSIVSLGQAALESVFLELLTDLLPSGTTISTVFPSQVLTRQSKEAGVLRRWLVEKFGLRFVIQYPADGLFANLTKQTLILVGQPGTEVNNVSHVEIEIPLRNLDGREIFKAMKDDSASSHVLKRTDFLAKDLLASSNAGWRFISQAASEAIYLINENFSNYPTLGSLEIVDIRRGTIGNGGNTKFTVFPNSASDRPSFLAHLPESWIKPVLNSTKKMPRLISLHSCSQSSILPPLEAYSTGTAENALLRDAISSYLSGVKINSGVQAKATKTVEDVLKNLRSDQKEIGSGWAVIQRASRNFGEVSFMEEPVLISSNALLLKYPDETSTRLAALWYLSIFGQLQLELHGVNQEGMRKLEISNLRQTIIPDFEKLTKDSIEDILSCFHDEPIDFQAVRIRPIDKAWAKAFGGSKEDSLLNQAKTHLESLIDERHGLGAS